MWKGVTVVTKPTADPVSLTQLKQRLAIDGSDLDTRLSELRRAAVALIDGPDGIGFAMMQQTWRKSMDAFPSCIELPGAPIKSITSITYVDVDGVTQTLSSSLYRVDLDQEPARITPAFGQTWPGTRAVTGAVKVDYLLGESDAAEVPGGLIDAVCLMVGHRLANPEAAADRALTPVPLGFEYLTAQYRRVAMAA